MKEQIKAPEKIQLSNKEIANLSDEQFKTLVIKKLTELVEFGCQLDEKMKAMLRETKENVQGTNSDGKETGTQINGVDQKEERNIQPEKNKETRIQKNEERLRNLQDILLYPAKLSFRMKGQIKCFSDKVKLKEFIITKPLLYEMLKGLI